MKTIKKICILCAYRFPDGMAPTTRILAYSKGLQENGVDVEVVSFERVVDERKKRIDGVAKEVPYHIPYCYDPKMFDNRLYRILWANWKQRFACINELRKINRTTPIGYVLLSFDDPLTMFFFASFLRLYGIRSTFIGDEFPEPIRQLKEKVPCWMIKAFKLAYKFIDLRVLMTKALQEYYDNIVCPKPTYILNSVIDAGRFESIENRDDVEPYLCYMGNMMLAKDNIDNIIHAFAKIAQDFSELKLYLYGTPNNADKQTVVNLIGKYGLEERVLLKGKASYDEVPNILGNAKVLVTSQPLTKRAQGGFPTKMCEYMMTGVPTILTDVGEIHQYVEDGVNAYMVEACNPGKYAEKLRYILLHYDDALQVAQNAKELVLNTYSSKQATKGLVDFFNEYYNYGHRD